MISSEEKLRYLVAVSVSNGFSPNLVSKISEDAPSSEGQYSGLFHLSESKLKRAAKLVDGSTWGLVDNWLNKRIGNKVSVLHYWSDKYPTEFRHIPQPPLVLYIRSMSPIPKYFWSEDDSSIPYAVGVVGARDASEYGLQVARELGADVIAASGAVVSGLALGIDTAALGGAVNQLRRVISTSQPSTASSIPPATAHKVVAVLGSGVEHIYPKSNVRLAEAIIASGGMLMSEYGLDTTPQKYYFPQRNRLISALSDAVVIVEAAKKSGALITADFANEQGKDVYAVPGRIDNPVAEGVNELLKKGASLYTALSDIDEFARAAPKPTSVPTTKATTRSMSVPDGISGLGMGSIRQLFPEPATGNTDARSEERCLDDESLENAIIDAFSIAEELPVGELLGEVRKIIPDVSIVKLKDAIGRLEIEGLLYRKPSGAISTNQF